LLRLTNWCNMSSAKISFLKNLYFNSWKNILHRLVLTINIYTKYYKIPPCFYLHRLSINWLNMSLYYTFSALVNDAKWRGSWPVMWLFTRSADEWCRITWFIQPQPIHILYLINLYSLLFQLIKFLYFY